MSVNSGALQASAEMGHSAARQRSADKPPRTGVLAGLVASHSRAQCPGQPVATRPTAPPVCEKAMLQRSLTGKFLFQGFTVCLIIIGSGNYLIIGTSAILINSKAEPCHVNELPIPLVCQKRVKRALRAHQALKGPFQSLHTDTLG